MKNFLQLFVIVFVLTGSGCSAGEFEPLDGDIIFHTSLSSQSKALQLATGSKYSHMGVIFHVEGKNFVYEAVNPVRRIALSEWIAKGEKEHYKVYRLKNRDEIFTEDKAKALLKTAESFLGKGYDLYFEWSDERLYCSELVWKVYKKTLDLEIGKLEVFKDMDLSHPAVQEKMKERYGDKPPMDEKIITPPSMMESDLLVEVYSN